MSQTHLICPQCKKGYFITLPNSVNGLRTLKAFKDKHKRLLCADCIKPIMPPTLYKNIHLATALVHVNTDRINGIAYNCTKCTNSYVEGIDGCFGWCKFCATLN